MDVSGVGYTSGNPLTPTVPHSFPHAEIMMVSQKCLCRALCSTECDVEGVFSFSGACCNRAVHSVLHVKVAMLLLLCSDSPTKCNCYWGHGVVSPTTAATGASRYMFCCRVLLGEIKVIQIVWPK